MATKNIVPRADAQGKIGTATKQWSEIRGSEIYEAGNRVATLASPILTGDPKAPTPSPGDDDTSIATSAFVQAAIDALSADVAGPGAAVVADRIVTWNGTPGTDVQDGGNTIAEVLDRTNHTGTQPMSTISNAGNSATKDVGTGSGDVAAGDDSRFTDSRTPTAHAASHIKGGSDEIDGDQLDIDVTFVNFTPVTSDPNVSDAAHLGAVLAGIDAALVAAYDAEQARDDVGAALTDTNSVSWTLDDGADTISAAVARKTAGLTANSQGSVNEDGSGIFVDLGTTNNKAASGADSRFPAADEKAALAGTDGTPSAGNPYVTDSDSRLGAASAHAIDHIRGGSDEIDGDKLDIDWEPSNYSPATTPSEVTNVDHLTAHLYGIDQTLAKRVVHREDITSLDGETAADLDSIPTDELSDGYSVSFFDNDAADIFRVYELVGGADAQSSPDIIRPIDYAATSNEKVWKLRSLSAPATTRYFHQHVVSRNGEDFGLVASNQLMFRFPFAITIKATTMQSSAAFTSGNATLNLKKTGAGDNTQGAAFLSADLACTSGGAELSDTLTEDESIAADAAVFADLTAQPADNIDVKILVEYELA